MAGTTGLEDACSAKAGSIVLYLLGMLIQISARVHVFGRGGAGDALTTEASVSSALIRSSGVLGK
jgi:hypothetical protein